MTQINLAFNKLPRDLAEFCFFIVVGTTAGYLGLIWKNNFTFLLVMIPQTEIGILLQTLVVLQVLPTPIRFFWDSSISRTRN